FQVTLRWLRLGGIIAVSLVGVAAATAVRSHGMNLLPPFLFPALMFIAQLMAVQVSARATQRTSAGMGWLACVGMAALQLHPSIVTAMPAISPPALLLTYGLASALAGGFLMTMLLGHAYLTAGNEMTQKPFMRLVYALAILLGLRIAASLLFGLRPWW